jgi:hypothetical protein
MSFDGLELLFRVRTPLLLLRLRLLRNIARDNDIAALFAVGWTVTQMQAQPRFWRDDGPRVK